MQRRRTRQQQFESACERLESFLESENPRLSLPRTAVGTVFLMQGFEFVSPEGTSLEK